MRVKTKKVMSAISNYEIATDSRYELHTENTRPDRYSNNKYKYFLYDVTECVWCTTRPMMAFKTQKAFCEYAENPEQYLIKYGYLEV